LVESESGADIVTFLRGRGPRACIVAPDWLRQRVVGDRPAAKGRHSAAWLQGADGVGELSGDVNNFIAIAEDAERETALIGSLAPREGSKVFGLFSHVLPALLCSVNGMASGHPVADLKRYAIICVPRSGSRYLSALLSRYGVGMPREHIRDPMAHVISEGRMGFGPAITALERFGQKNGIFGTKLISTFLLRASHGRFSELKQNLTWMHDRGYRLVRLHRAVEETTVSSYIAYQMQKWHFFREMDEAARARLNALEFEDGAAWDEFVRFRAEKVIVDSLTRTFDMPTIPYSEIEANAQKIVSDLCELIGADASALKPGSALVPIPTRSESPTYEVFAHRLASLLERRAADVVPATVKKLRAIGKMTQDEAEALVADGAG
jgi:LPS sulfotransferase NodH